MEVVGEFDGGFLILQGFESLGLEMNGALPNLGDALNDQERFLGDPQPVLFKEGG